MKRIRLACITLSAICVACAFVQSSMCLRYQQDKYTAYDLGVSARQFEFTEETGPDVTKSELEGHGSGYAPTGLAYSLPIHIFWDSSRSGDLDAPDGKQFWLLNVRSVGAGTVAAVFALIWSVVSLFESIQRPRKTPRGFDVVSPGLS